MARTRIAKFNIQVTASAEQVRQVFSRLRDNTKSVVGELTSSLTSVSFAWNEISSAVGPVIDAFQQLNEELLDLGQISRRLEVAPAFLQTLEIAASDVGLELEDITDALRDFQERVGQLRRGETTPTEVFAELGLTASQVSRDLSVAFEQVRQGLIQIEDQTIRASIATELFGEKGRDMLQLFAPGVLRRAAAELDSVGGAISIEDVSRLEEFNKAWGDLSRRFKLIGQQLTIELAPALQGVLAALERILRPIDTLQRVMDRFGITRSQLAFTGNPGLAYLTRPREAVAGAQLAGIQSQATRQMAEQTRLLRSIDSKTLPGTELITSGVQ